MNEKGRIRAVFLIFASALTGFAWGQSLDINLSYECQWSIPQLPSLPILPLKVTLENPGGDISAQVVFRRGSDVIRSGIELPAQTEKSLIMYVPNTAGNWQPATLDLISSRTVAHIDLPMSYSADANTIAMIGDDVGGMEFMRQRPVKSPHAWDKAAYTTMYGEPGLVPTRGAAYLGLQMVVLGDGAERLSDDEIRALKSGVLAGTTLVFVGGASKPVFSDPRWSELLPVQVGEVAQGGPLPSLAAYGASVPLSFAATQSEMKAGAQARLDGGKLVVAWKAVGQGSVVFLPFDPFAGDFRRWEGRKGLFFAIQKWVRANRRVELPPGTLWNGGQDRAMVSSASAVTVLGSTPGSVVSSVSSNQEDQSIFAVEMPPAWKIGLILLAYMVLVVPANFLILRKLGKGEWAWITAPLLAVVFSAGFFSFSGSLYNQGRSKQTDALIVASSEAGLAYVRGQEQIFIPQGGQYDLKWNGVEAASQPTNFEYGERSTSGETLDMVEAGTLRAPRVAVPNLAFRTYDYSQVMDWKFLKPGKLTITRGAKNKITIRGEIKNTSNTKLIDAYVEVSGYYVEIGSLNPGESKQVNWTNSIRSNDQPAIGSLIAKVSAEGLGSQIGAKELGQVNLRWDIEVEAQR